MSRPRLLAVTLSLALAASACVAVAGVVAADDADVAISGVNVSPDSPSPGNQFTVTANISNLASSNGTVRVTDVYVRVPGGTTEYTRVENPGSITPGNTLSVPLSLSVSETGERNLRVHVVVETADGDHQRLEYPVLLSVSEPNEALVSVPASEATVDEDTPVNVTVANGDSSAISSVTVRLSGDGSVNDAKRITGSIEPGADRSFTYDVVFDERGTKKLDATVTFTTSEDVTRTVTDSATFEVTNESTDSGAQIEGEIRLIGVDSSGSGIVTLQGDAANVGGTNVKSVLLRVKNTESVSPMGSSGEYFVGAVNESKFDTFELIARTSGGATTIPVHLEYIVDGEKRTDTVNINASSTGDTSRGIPDEERGPVQPRTPISGQQAGLLGGLGSLVVPAVVLVGLVGGAYVVWKRR